MLDRVKTLLRNIRENHRRVIQQGRPASPVDLNNRSRTGGSGIRLRGAVIASTAARATTESTANLTTDDVTNAWPRQRSPACATCSAFLMSPEVTITARLGSHRTPRWRETDSNPRSPSYRELGAPGRARHDTRRHREKPGTPIVHVNELQRAFSACPARRDRPASLSSCRDPVLDRRQHPLGEIG
jgi:hypothetical protein